jgi:hypothetical protein
MLVGAYPFEDHTDPRNFSKTIKVSRAVSSRAVWNLGRAVLWRAVVRLIPPASVLVLLLSTGLSLHLVCWHVDQ